MKKNDIILIVSVALYSYLFYQQEAGINYLIFNIILITGSLLKNKETLTSKYWLASAAGSLLSAVCIFIYGGALPVIANILSLSLTAVYSTGKESSLIFSLIYAAFSYCFSLIYSALQYFDNVALGKTPKKTTYSYLSISVVPIVIFLVFFFLYREGSPVFKMLTRDVNLDFLTFGWLGFTILGTIVLFGYYYPKTNATLEATDTLLSDNLYKKDISETEKLNKLSKENQSAVIMFVLLNLLLFFVNLSDGYYLMFSQNLPEGISHSEFVHQGVYTIITSIVFAIVVILYYFRGDLNFYKGSNVAKRLTSLWILQNIVLVFMTVAKNNIYIAEYSLTYKRIGVFIYLLLTLIGLVVTVIKVIKVKSNWFLVRKNSWAFYVVLIISCFINWDLLIIKYNINYSKDLDKEYLLSLGHTAIPHLLNLYQGDNSSHQYWISDFHKDLKDEAAMFKNEYEQKDWQSFNLEESGVYKKIKLLKTDENKTTSE